MVIHTIPETETRFKRFLIQKGYKRGDLRRESSIALEQYMDREEKNLTPIPLTRQDLQGTGAGTHPEVCSQ